MKRRTRLDSPLIPLTLQQLHRLMCPTNHRTLDAERLEKESGWVAKKQITKRFGVSARTVDNWLTRGMPHFKPSARMVRFWIPDCDEWYRRQFGAHGTERR